MGDERKRSPPRAFGRIVIPRSFERWYRKPTIKAGSAPGIGVIRGRRALPVCDPKAAIDGHRVGRGVGEVRRAWRSLAVCSGESRESRDSAAVLSIRCRNGGVAGPRY